MRPAAARNRTPGYLRVLVGVIPQQQPSDDASYETEGSRCGAQQAGRRKSCELLLKTNLLSSVRWTAPATGIWRVYNAKVKQHTTTAYSQSIRLRASSRLFLGLTGNFVDRGRSGQCHLPRLTNEGGNQHQKGELEPAERLILFCIRLVVSVPVCNSKLSPFRRSFCTSLPHGVRFKEVGTLQTLSGNCDSHCACCGWKRPDREMEVFIIWIAQGFAWICSHIDTFISMCDVLLKLLGCFLQQMVFGELRLHDDSMGKDRLWNFVFYKFIFVFGVLNVSQAEAIVSWGAWFSLLGFLHLLTQLCQDRFDYISVPTQLPRGTHVRIVALLFGLLTACGFLHVAAYNHARNKGLNYFLLVDAEVFLISVKIAYAFVRYGVHMWETFAERTASDRRAEVSYYLELGLQLSILGVEFLHDLHMLIWGNVFLSMASVVISMRLHSTFTELKRRIGKHQHYARISQLLVGKYPSAAPEQLDDPCAICWENMHSARVLPCRHLFHETCLRSWLEQDISCPTCRLHLDIDKKHPKLEVAAPDIDEDTLNVPGTSQHVFHFDGSRFISWLPTVSVELSTSPVVLEEFQRAE